MQTNNRWRSRKFIVTMIAQATAMATLLWPQHESAIAQVGSAVSALLVVGLSAVGYVLTEGTIDRERATNTTRDALSR